MATDNKEGNGVLAANGGGGAAAESTTEKVNVDSETSASKTSVTNGVSASPDKAVATKKSDLVAANNNNKTNEMAGLAVKTTTTTTTATESPEEKAWLLSTIFFLWATSMFKRAAFLHKQEQALEQEDLLNLASFDHGHVIAPIFERAWKTSMEEEELEKQKRQVQDKLQATATGTTGGSSGSGSDPERKDTNSTARLTHAAFRVMGSRFIIAGLIKVLNSALQFSFPILLNNILKFIEQSQAGEFDGTDAWSVRYRGYWLSALLFLAMASKAVTENSYFHRVYRCGYQVRVAVSLAVYNKSLRLANAERQSTTLGELINLMQVDATKIEMFIPQIHVLWDGALQITGYITILYFLIGWPCFAGLIIMMAAVPVQGSIMQRLFALNRNMVKYTDARVKTTNEALQGIQCVKMYTWETSFLHSIGLSRNQELTFLRGLAYLKGFSRAYMGAVPGLVAVGSFVVFSLAVNDGKDVSASTIFAALVAFDQLRFPLMFYPMALAQLAQAKVSAGRVEAFLNMKEVGAARSSSSTGGVYIRNEEPKAISSSSTTTASSCGEIVLKDATIYWSDPTVPISHNSIDDNASSTSLRVSEHGASSEIKTIDEEGEIKVYPKPILENITLHVKPGELTAVVGRVASGKSTLCSAILNEAFLASGEIALTGKVAYAAQSPWILNATLRDNILFGEPMDEERYQRVISACQLEHDLAMLEDGDLTEIGEKGINLSGGQKQRISVARAAYSTADTIILDDPLSALDPEVGRLLFEQCILDVMKGRTRLLVTNQIQFLRYCDSVVALGKRRVLEQGSFDDLTASSGGEIMRLLAEAGEQSAKKRKKSDADIDEAEQTAAASGNKAAGKKEEKAKTMMTKEERMIGAVSWSVYKKYMKSGGGFFKFGCVFMGYILCSANTVASSAWISYWTSDAPEYAHHSLGFYLALYAALAVSLGIFTYIRSFFLVRFGVVASGQLHEKLLNSILRAPQSFFDTTPVGRILSRFSKDMYSVDIELSDTLDMFLFCSIQVVMGLATIIFITPWFGVAVVPLAVAYFRTMNYFRDVSRETKRLESISRSPVYAQFSETLGGLSTIRAYGQPSRFMYDFESKVDQNTRAYYCNKAADRWLSVRLELVGATIAGLAAAFATNVALNHTASGQGSSNNFASFAGLSLMAAISMTGLLNWCVRTFAQLEASMNACERVLYYSESIPQEAPWTSEELEKFAASGATVSSALAVRAAGGKTAPFGPQWPEKGSIVLQNLKMKYRPETPFVLNGLNVVIAGGERIGVVGRTGSGKSSLLLTLLRLVEPYLSEPLDDYNAPISIDGVDVLRVGLRELRSKLGIIPQNPVLFSGTIRSNVDPFSDYSDEQIWAALDRCGLKVSVEAMPGQLGATVSEYGENLSAGMRQMLVLGRALLKQCRVLLLDEATSSVDFETDRAIQRTLREAFPGCTVLTIAHRINTILDSDKILVMKDGFAAEFAPPQELLQDENSIFSEIVRHSKSEKN